jgi:hypothetical protein
VVFNVVFGLVLLVVLVTLVVAVVRGRPPQPPHKPGSLVGTYKRGGRSYQSFVNRRVRHGRPRGRRR